MKSGCDPTRRRVRPSPSLLPIFLIASLLVVAVAAVCFPPGRAAASSRVVVSPLQVANDTCATATVINPSSLPFLQDSTTDGAANDVDPGPGGCVSGAGPDVIYSFTPAVSDQYTIGATPIGTGFDLSLYVLTDCSNPLGSCLAGANSRGFGKGETLTINLTAGTRYFIVVDSPIAEDNQGPFHFSLRRGTPANDGCSSPAVIDPSRLGSQIQGTTFGAVNSFNPGTPCLRSNQSATGPDVVYQFTPAGTQNYDITVIPAGNFDVTVYLVTSCSSLAGCSSADVGGGGDAETLRRRLELGITYFIIVDGFQGDAGDFTISILPTIPMSPAAPSELTATVVSTSRVDLAWRDNSNDELGFRIERSTDGANFTEIGTVGANVTSFSDTTVSPNTTYFYRVFAFNNFGSSDPSNVADASTQAPPPPPVPIISVVPELVDFGSVGATRSATRTVTIKNNGGVDLVITAITDPNAPFSIVNKPALPITLAPGQMIELTVRFDPTFVGPVFGLFTIQSNDPAAPTIVVSLRGIGSPAPVPNLEITPGLVDFSGGSGSAGIIFRNTGDADLLITSISTPGAPFTIAGRPSFPVTLRPGESFVLIVAFSPGAQGVFTASVTVVSNDPDQLLTVIPLRGTSTATNEQLKLKAPTLVTAVAGQATTLNVIATNGTNSNITLEASAIPGGTFTDNGGGRGVLVFTPPASASGPVLVTFTARDSTGRVKTLQSVISILAAANTHTVRVSWVAPTAAGNPPTGVVATDQSITLLSVEPQQATGLAGYVIYRSQTAGVPVSLSNIVGVVPAAQTSFTDTVPTPPNSSQVFFYVVTALYSSGTESAASNEATTGPRLVGLEVRKKAIRFIAANSNVAVGAVLIVDGRETFPLTRDGDFIVVTKNARSTPGGLRVRDIFTGNSSHTVQVRNPNGATSPTLTLSK